jgi:hypothetical protein
MAHRATLSSPVHGGGVSRRREADGGGGHRTDESRPFHHPLFASLGERSPSPALRGRK